MEEPIWPRSPLSKARTIKRRRYFDRSSSGGELGPTGLSAAAMQCSVKQPAGTEDFAPLAAGAPSPRPSPPRRRPESGGASARGETHLTGSAPTATRTADNRHRGGGR